MPVIVTAVDLAEFQPGYYLHYKSKKDQRRIYFASHLSEDMSRGRIQVAYVPCYLEAGYDHLGNLTRDFAEFIFDQVHFDGSLCDELGNRPGSPNCGHDLRLAWRYHFLGFKFEPWMLEVDPWNLP